MPIGRLQTSADGESLQIGNDGQSAAGLALARNRRTSARQPKSTTDAISCYRRALDLYQALGELYGEADVLVRLGDTQYVAGDPTPPAQSHLQGESPQTGPAGVRPEQS